MRVLFGASTSPGVDGQEARILIASSRFLILDVGFGHVVIVEVDGESLQVGQLGIMGGQIIGCALEKQIIVERASSEHVVMLLLFGELVPQSSGHVGVGPVGRVYDVVSESGVGWENVQQFIEMVFDPLAVSERVGVQAVVSAVDFNPSDDVFDWRVGSQARASFRFRSAMRDAYGFV